MPRAGRCRTDGHVQVCAEPPRPRSRRAHRRPLRLANRAPADLPGRAIPARPEARCGRRPTSRARRSCSTRLALCSPRLARAICGPTCRARMTWATRLWRTDRPMPPGQMVDPLLAKSAQGVRHRLWPGLIGSAGPLKSVEIQARWCQPWVSHRETCSSSPRTVGTAGSLTRAPSPLGRWWLLRMAFTSAGCCTCLLYPLAGASAVWCQSLIDVSDLPAWWAGRPRQRFAPPGCASCCYLTSIASAASCDLPSAQGCTHRRAGSVQPYLGSPHVHPSMQGSRSMLRTLRCWGAGSPATEPYP